MYSMYEDVLFLETNFHFICNNFYVLNFFTIRFMRSGYLFFETLFNIRKKYRKKTLKYLRNTYLERIDITLQQRCMQKLNMFHFLRYLRT